MSERLNAGVPVTAVASAIQASLRFSDARVVLEDILHLDSDNSVPGMLSRHGRTTLFTDDFWNVRHICTTADSNGRVSVVPGGAPPGIALFVPSRFLDARSRTTVREMFLQVRSGPDAQAPLGVCRVPQWSCSSPEDARHGSLRLEPRHGG